MVGLSTYEINGGAIPGGVKIIEYVPIDWIDTYPKGVIDEITKASIVLKAGRSWLTAPVSAKIAWSESQKKTVQGTAYDQSLQFFYPSYSPEIRDELTEMAAHQFVIIVPLRIGVSCVIGTKEFGLDFTADFATGQDFTGAVGSSLNFKGETARKSPVLID